MLHQIGDTRINVVEEGEGHPVILLHANLLSWRNWIPQLDVLSDRFRCIALDIRGYGSSDRTEPLGIERYADDVAEVCAVLGIAHTHVIGISLGGIVAQAVAIRHPGLVHRLVLANTTGGNDPSIADRVRQAAQTIRAEGLTRVLDANFAATVGVRFREQHPDQARAMRRELESADPLTVAATSDALATYDHRDRLCAIAAPTLVIQGELDGLMSSENGKLLAREIPHARLVTLTGVGHLSNVEAPDAFNREVMRFLDALDP